MTTAILYGDYLVADTRAYAGNADNIGAKTKVHVVRPGFCFATTSTKPGLSEFVSSWIYSGCPPDPTVPDSFKGFEFDTLVYRDGEAFLYISGFDEIGPMEAPFHSVGSGSRIAQGAMAAGAGALEAIRICSDYDIWTSGPYDMVDCLTGEVTRHE